MGKEFAEVRKTKIRIEVEAELRQLDGEFDRKSARANPIEDIQIVFRYRSCLFAVSHVFSEMGENGADVGSPQLAAGGDGLFQSFPWEKSPNRTPQNARASGVLP